MWAVCLILLLPAAAFGGTDFPRACPAEQQAPFPSEKVALCENETGTIAEAGGRIEEARNHYLNALAAWDKLGPGSLSNHIATLMNLGALYRRQDRLADAEKVSAEALDLARTIAGTEPGLYATVLSRSAGLYSDLAQPDRARRMLNEAISTLHTLTPPNTPELARAYNSLGMLDLTDGLYPSGEANLRQAVTFAGKSLGEDNPETAVYSTNLALALFLQGQYSRAGTVLRRARFVIENRLGPDSVELVNVLAELTSVETGLGRFRIAEDCGEKALAILNSQVPARTIEIALAQVNLARLYLREHKTAEAEKILPAAIEHERQFLRDGRTLGDGIRNLAELRTQQHAWKDAESLYREAIALYEHKLGAGHPDIAPVLHEYAAVLKHQGASKNEIRNIEARARAIESSASRPRIT